MTERSSNYRPIFDKEHFRKGVNYIQGRIHEASTPEQTFKAYLLYGRLIGVHALVGLSALIDRVFPEPPPPTHKQ